MKKAHLYQGTLTVLLLASSVAHAQEYPASDFQPKVLFRDESIVVPAAEPPTSSATPCAMQQPASSAPVATQAVEEADSKYPASSFQPKVIYSQ